MENPISDIEQQIRSVKEMCLEHLVALEDTDELALMTTAAEVLNGLEKAFHTYFHNPNKDHIFSPKSVEPWD